MNRTLVIFKPEVIENCLVSTVFKYFDDVGLRPVTMKQMVPTKDMMREHYSDLVGKYSDDIIEDTL